MNPIIKIVKSFSKNTRKKRAQIFKNAFCLDQNTKILDLGSETGSNIYEVIKGTEVLAHNVFIADIDSTLVEIGKENFSFTPVHISESERLPFNDKYFDIVYCSSVIEHVTVPKEKVWSVLSGKRFKNLALKRQKEFADEIKRLGRQYFVQTPYKHFPVESHTWLPFLSWIPRRILIQLLKFTNLFWVKKTSPDWHLLNKKEMSGLFFDSKLVPEKSFGLIKSLMAIKSLNNI